MQMQTSTNTHLINYTLTKFRSRTWYNIFWVIFGSILLALSSKIQIPYLPVPFTMQTYILLVLSMAMGTKLAIFTVALYLLEGALGLPVFASGAGISYMFGPTGGFLVGFLIAAIVVSYLADYGFDKKIVTSIIAMTIGTALVFFPGILWLANLIGIEKALQYGLYPFWFSIIFKLILGAFTLPTAWKLIHKQ